jgi:hypothetical protein
MPIITSQERHKLFLATVRENIKGTTNVSYPAHALKVWAAAKLVQKGEK